MSSMLEVLFSSIARVQILRLFLLNPDRPFYQREIGRETDQPIRAVQREMDRLAGIGLLARRSEGHRVFYCLAPDFPLLAELTALFQKAEGAEPAVREASRAPATRAASQDPAAVRQPFGWMETPAAQPLPKRLRQAQADREWDQGY